MTNQRNFSRFFLSSLFTAIAALTIVPILLAQSAEQLRPPNTTPDFSGVWRRVGGTGGPRRFSPEEAPLQPWAMDIYKANREGRAPNEGGRDDQDPLEALCFPPGPTRAMLRYPFELFQTPDRIVMVFEIGYGIRRIWLDGREHPEGWPFGWMGHSIGRWEGDTLVVDTLGLNDKTWLDSAGTPHSDALHIVERFRRTAPDTMEVEFWFDDPKAFTEPWGGKKVYQLSPETEIFEVVLCEDELVVPGFRLGRLDP